MTKVVNAVLACVFAAASASAVDSDLLKFVMPDAKFVSGIHVESAKGSRFGQYVLSQMQVDDPSFQQFIADTQFDPRRDLTDIVVATAGSSDNPTFLVVGRGRFNPAAITTAAVNSGATLTSSGILTHPGKNSTTGALAFVDAGTALMGTLSAVQDALSRQSASSSFADQAAALSSKYDAWFFSTGPVTDFFAGKLPGAAGGMQGNLMQAVKQASGGLKFSQSDVTISGVAVAASDKDAEALRDVVKFVAGLVQLNRDSNTETQKVASLLDTMTVSATGNTMQLSLSIPEDVIETLFMPHANRPAKAKVRKIAAVHGIQ